MIGGRVLSGKAFGIVGWEEGFDGVGVGVRVGWKVSMGEEGG